MEVNRKNIQKALRGLYWKLAIANGVEPARVALKMNTLGLRTGQRLNLLRYIRQGFFKQDPRSQRKRGIEVWMTVSKLSPDTPRIREYQFAFTKKWLATLNEEDHLSTLNSVYGNEILEDWYILSLMRPKEPVRERPVETQYECPDGVFARIPSRYERRIATTPWWLNEGA